MEAKLTGLTSQEVSERIQVGKVNADADVRTRSIPRIILDNICTLFNAVNLVLALAILWTGSYRNLLFFGVVIFNVAIGIVQEIKSKLTIDKLSVLTSTKARVLRDGEEATISLNDIVLDDLVILRRGNQVPSDCIIVKGSCSANESLLTGESDLVSKKEGDELYSGSFISSGSCTAKVCAVGADNYATSINNEAKEFKKVRSDMMEALGKIIKFSTILIIPMGVLLFCKEFFLTGGTATDSILHSSAALVGMIPQGFILLTSGVLAISVVRLAKHKVLVQELYCVETLARVDVVCLDKTGTITTGEMDVDELLPLGSTSKDDAMRALIALNKIAEVEGTNETTKAIEQYVAALDDELREDAVLVGQARIIPFSSEKKYSGICFAPDDDRYVMGAAEFVFKGCEDLPHIQQIIKDQAGARRVLVLARVQDFGEDGSICGQPEALALLFIKDRIRPTAKQTLKYFKEQGVRINIISGDAVETVKNIAACVEVPDADKCVDMTTITSDEELARVAKECRIFARVSPEQKKKLVKALQEQGHTVAMTGDGVNDVLALHSADCSVAMGSGSDAARNIAQLILMDDDFASMPRVVAEGRRSINNLQRSGALFLVKTLFSAFLALVFLFIMAFDYPFVTIQLTLVGSFTIGLPSFVLALEPNTDIVRGDFLRNIVSRAIPGASAICLAVLVACVCSYILGLSQEQFSTLCVILSCVAGINFVFRLSIPFTLVRIALFVVIVLGIFLGIFVFPSVFMLTKFSFEMVCVTVALAVVICIFFNLLFNAIVKHEEERLAKL